MGVQIKAPIKTNINAKQMNPNNRNFSSKILNISWRCNFNIFPRNSCLLGFKLIIIRIEYILVFDYIVAYSILFTKYDYSSYLNTITLVNQLRNKILILILFSCVKKTNSDSGTLNG